MDVTKDCRPLVLFTRGCNFIKIFVTRCLIGQFGSMETKLSLVFFWVYDGGRMGCSYNDLWG